MNQIRHRVGIKTTLDAAYRATHHPNDLSGWWPQKAHGAISVGSKLVLEFPGYTEHEWEIVRLVPNQLVVLRMLSGPDVWGASVLRFELEESDGQVWVTLVHETSPEVPPEAHQYFCTKWPTFLVSLKALLETGKGMPYPDDIKIQD